MATLLTTRYQTLGISLLMAVLAGCGGGSSPTALVPEESETFAAVEVTETGLPPEVKDTDLSVGTSLAVTDVNPNAVRLMAANITSGTNQSYDPGHGTRIFQGLDPDIVLIQEFNYGDNSNSAISSYVSSTFGPGFSYYRESGAQIPNGIISRYPILAAGEWDDSSVSNRDFAWARIDIPGTKDLWAISVHLLTSSSGVRNTEAQQLRNYINANIPANDYVVIGGDFNTSSLSESAYSTLSSVVNTTKFSVDQQGKSGTNASRSKPYDRVLLDAELTALEVPVQISGVGQTFPNGLVFDSRVFSPLSAVSPVLSGDSGSQNMQHMAVIRDFSVTAGGTNPTPTPTSTPAPTPTPTPAPTPSTGGSTVALTSGVTRNDSVSSGQWDQFYIDVPAGATQLLIEMTGTGDADLYVKKGSQPTSSSYDQRPYLNGSAETVTISNPSAARYYIGVNGYSTASYALKATVTQGSTGGGSTSQPVTLLNQSGTVSSGQWRNYTINVPSGKSKVTVTMTGSGDADLYIKYGSSYPTTTSYDFRPYLDGSNETVVISGSSNPALKTGQYYVSVNGYASSSNFSVSAIAE